MVATPWTVRFSHSIVQPATVMNLHLQGVAPLLFDFVPLRVAEMCSRTIHPATPNGVSKTNKYLNLYLIEIEARKKYA
jgi:hypothetical protein